MATPRSRHQRKGSKEPPAITGLRVRGFKSLVEATHIELRSLTVLAGANSSGKSSIIQPLLLMKQTLEAPFDPGALRISGPNVLFTSVDQFLSRTSGIAHGDNFEFLIEISREYSVRLSFSRHAREGVQLDEMEYAGDGEHLILRPDMNESALEGALENSKEFASFRKFYTEKIAESLQLQVRRNRFWLEIGVLPRSNGEGLRFGLSPAGVVPNCIGRIIHVPGLRGNPERTYRTTAVAGEFPGLFNDYVASIVHFWKLRGDQRLALLGKHLKRLGLTWKVETRQVDDTRVEVRVGRLPQASRGGARDMVSIADVGFGVSQTLPVVVALLAAEPGQLVYLEQPEIHLHPRAQVHLAELMVAAANRGVRLIVETHSSLLILSLQALVAEGKISSRTLSYIGLLAEPKMERRILVLLIWIKKVHMETGQ